jgi:V8-like Glu-specific endopeptidase
MYDQAILTELRKLLAALYPSEADQRRLAAEAGLTVGAIAFSPAAFNSWHAILQHARNNQSIPPLLALAMEEYPENAQLKQLASGQHSTFVDGKSFDWQGPKNGRSLLEQLVSGKPSLVHVSHLEVGLERARAVAKLVRAEGGSGTGFLIGGDRLLTNHHVLPDVQAAAHCTALFNYQRASAGHEETITELKLAPERFFQTSAADDWTVVGMEPGAVARWGHIALAPSSARRGDLVNIIQHPGGGPKQIAISFDVVAFSGSGRLQYLTDTLPGSSGSPVFDRNWNLVALHHSGGWLPEPGSTDKRVYYRNEGILIDCILEQLQGGDAGPSS